MTFYSPVKLRFGDRITLNEFDGTIAGLMMQAASQFRGKNLSITGIDADGDWVTVSSDKQALESIEFQKSSLGKKVPTFCVMRGRGLPKTKREHKCKGKKKECAESSGEESTETPPRERKNWRQRMQLKLLQWSRLGNAVLESRIKELIPDPITTTDTDVSDAGLPADAGNDSAALNPMKERLKSKLLKWSQQGEEKLKKKIKKWIQKGEALGKLL